MILAAAVCPHPPLLVPQVASGATAELDDLRRCCDEAVAAVLGHHPDCVVIVGAGELIGGCDESAGGSLASYGVDVHAGGGSDVLPLSLTIGAWLLDRARWAGPRTYTTEAVPIDGSDDRTVLLVMADGSAKRTSTAPGFLDERAEAFDDGIAAALAHGDAAALAGLDVDLGAELWAAGVPALRALGEMTKGADITARLRCEVAPYGVGYWVADWVIG